MTSIAFDLDGTLIESLPDLHRAVSGFLADMGKPPLDLLTVQGFVGNGVPTLVERVARASGLATDSGALAAHVAAFSKRYQADPVALTTLYPGVRASLKALCDAGHTLSICTNKPEAPTRAILDHFDLTPVFGPIIGGDSLPVRKPEPAPLLAALGGKAGLFVGDSEVDADTARAAGVPFLLFTEGYRRGPVADMPHAGAFQSFGDLPGLVAGCVT